MEKERNIGPGPGLVEIVTELTLEENPGYLKTEMAARFFVLLYIQVICHSPAPDKHLFVEKSVNNCSRLAFSISSYVASPIRNFEYRYLYQQTKKRNFPQYDRLPH
jgi:hypothetical protein